MTSIGNFGASDDQTIRTIKAQEIARENERKRALSAKQAHEIERKRAWSARRAAKHPGQRNRDKIKIPAPPGEDDKQLIILRRRNGKTHRTLSRKFWTLKPKQERRNGVPYFKISIYVKSILC